MSQVKITKLNAKESQILSIIEAYQRDADRRIKNGEDFQHVKMVLNEIRKEIMETESN